MQTAAQTHEDAAIGRDILECIVGENAGKQWADLVGLVGDGWFDQLRKACWKWGIFEMQGGQRARLAGNGGRHFKRVVGDEYSLVLGNRFDAWLAIDCVFHAQLLGDIGSRITK